jgi:ribosome biogenesis GTPase A
MTKTRRQIEADLKLVDIVVEIIDARIPASSRNPDIDAICAGKPRLIVLNRADQADPAQNRAWEAYFRSQGRSVLETDARSGRGINQFSDVVRGALSEQIARWREKGQIGRPVRAMVVGVPNVGKSTFINKVARKKSAKAGDRPGVTRGKQWVHVDQGLDLLDTPGILWPKFEDEATGMNLAYTGAVKDEIMDVETLGCHFMALLGERYPQALMDGYRLPELPAREEGENDAAWGYRLLQAAAAKRGMRISGGEVDTERMARVLLDEYRGGRLGRFTLELPEGM